MGLLDFLRGRSPELDEALPERSGTYPLSLAAYADFFKYGNNMYPHMVGVGNGNDAAQKVSESFESFITGLWRSNGIVFACMGLRLRVFSDVRFRFRKLDTNGTASFSAPSDGRNPASNSLRLLRSPEPGLTTGDFLAHAIQDIDLAGNFFAYRNGNRLQRLRPDWVTVVYGNGRKDASIWDLDTEVAGYLYQVEGTKGGRDPIPLQPEQVAHWAPQPDPMSPRLGMSWLTPIIREVLADSSATQHKQAFFDNDATVNQQLVFDKEIDKDTFDYAVEKFKENHEGVGNAYRTLFVLGAKLEKVGLDFAEMDFTNLQGKMETRIASAAGVGPILTFLSEGLQGSSLNAGNYNSARRSVADTTFRPLWRNFCGSIAHVVDEPSDSELWYDDRDCLFLQEDRKDAADIQESKARTIKALSEGGFNPDSVVDAVMAEDMGLLKHTGMLSVQLQEPGKEKEQPSTEIQPGSPVPNTDPKEAAQAIVAAIERQASAQPQPVFHLHSSPVEVHPAAVTVEPAQVTVNTPDVKPEINVTTPDVTVTTPPVEVHAAPVEVHTAPIEVQTPDVNVTNPAPAIDLTPVATIVAQAEENRRRDIAKAEAAAEARHEQMLLELKPKPAGKIVRRVERDANGLIARVVDEPEDN